MKFKKILKNLVLCQLVICLGVLSSGNIKFAKANTCENGVCISTEREDTIQDMNQLFELAIEQDGERSSIITNNNSIAATELVETRRFSNGAIEKDYMTTTFAVANNFAPSQPIDFQKYKEIMQGGYGVSFTCRANYTVRMDDIFSKNRVRLNNVTTTVQNVGSSIVAKNVTIEYKTPGGAYELRPFNCNPVCAPQTFTLQCKDSNFYYPHADDFEFSTEVYTYDGKSVQGRQTITINDI